MELPRHIAAASGEHSTLPGWPGMWRQTRSSQIRRDERIWPNERIWLIERIWLT